jgi:hypothetical protein
VEQEEQMGLYERLFEEIEKEERRRGRPLGAFYGLDSPVLDRRLANVPKDRVGDRADLYGLYQNARKGGVRSQDGAYRSRSLRARYREDYAELAAEVRGQGEIL